MARLRDGPHGDLPAGVDIAGGRDGQEIVDACEDGLTYGPLFIETSPRRFASTARHTTTASGGWPGAAGHTMKDYLLVHPANVQSRLR